VTKISNKSVILHDVSGRRPLSILAASVLFLTISHWNRKMAALRAVVFLAILSSCLAARFAMFPMFGRSHFMFVARLGQELAERGHEVCKLRLILLRKLVN